MPTREQLRVFASGLDDTAAIRKQVAAWLKARGVADGPVRSAMRERIAEPPKIAAPEGNPPDAITLLGWWPR